MSPSYSEQWLAVELSYSDGQIKRFGPDERDDADIPYSLQFDTQNPGGFHTASVTLPRPSDLQADDAKLFSHARFYGPGGQTVYEGLVTGIPQVGANEIRLEFEGWVNHLEHDESFRGLFVDRDMSHWIGPSVQRQINLGGSSIDVDAPRVEQDATTGAPSVAIGFSGVWSRRHQCEAYYDGQGLLVDSLYWAAKKGPNINTNFVIEANLVGDANDNGDIATSGDVEPSLPTTGTVDATGTHLFAKLALIHVAAGGADGINYDVFWTDLAVFGDHGLTKQGSVPGLLGSDIIAYALARSAPLLNFTLGDSIETSTFAIPHLVYLEDATVKKVIEDVTILGGAQLTPNDWGVYDGREFYWRSPGTYGKTWRVRKDQLATPTGEGPHAKERIGGIKIVYQDGAGKNHSVGPPGSGSETETTELLDTDPNNPAVALQRKWPTKNVGITNATGALNIGKMLMNEATVVDWRGTIKCLGEITDDAGNSYAPSRMRAGDRIVVEDDAYPTERPVASTSYNHDDLSVTANIGATPLNGESLLANLVAVTELATK